MMAIITREKLTKRFLMNQEYGVFIASNCWTSHPKHGGMPIFAEEVKSIKERHKQWERIKRLKANNRLCEVFPSRKDCFEYMRVLWNITT